jgi:hypothetical protein
MEGVQPNVIDLDGVVRIKLIKKAEGKDQLQGGCKGRGFLASGHGHNQNISCRQGGVK